MARGAASNTENALQVIYDGQTEYLPAGINGSVINDKDPRFPGRTIHYEILHAQLAKLPHKPEGG